MDQVKESTILINHLCAKNVKEGITIVIYSELKPSDKVILFDTLIDCGYRDIVEIDADTFSTYSVGHKTCKITDKATFQASLKIITL